jgi:Ca2+-transporting ATPase
MTVQAECAPAPRGLSSEQAARQLAAYGRNELAQGKRRSSWRMLAEQFANPVIWLLLAGAAISGALGEVADALAITAILVINAMVGFLQEHRAERAVLALRAMTAPSARVIRDGVQAMVPAAEVVPGDLLALEAGDIAAADATLIEAHALRANEAPLTGESAPVHKSLVPGEGEGGLGEQRDRVFAGTSIVAGAGRAIVTATGMATELGRVATLLDTAQIEVTPLQRRLAQVSRTLLIASVAIVLAVAAAGIVRGDSVFEVFLSAVALAVAAVPEALPAIVTIALAIGVRRMALRNALVRRLAAVETLGCTAVICTDKTGTLTTGVMTVRELWGPDHARLLDAAAACCDAELGDGAAAGSGDPTELAILAEAALHGIGRAAIERARPRVDEIPFDPDRKYMAVTRSDGRIYVKGAIEVVIPRCTAAAEGAVEAAAQMAERGLRVLAVAVGTGGEVGGLALLGVIGMADPPRRDAIAAVAAARRAGIRTVMITGDHPATAAAIARELGIVQGDQPSEGAVHARATPEDKLRIVRSWKARGAVVAMTGDGVNDAPALREAHVGIAMGKTGTQVTREVADIVLADDNFATIVDAVREGRGIFSNIRKALVLVLAGNVAELAVMLIASLAGLPLPFLPLQLLWINLVTDGLPALALVMDPSDGEDMARPPRPVDEPLLGAAQWRSILFGGALETGVALAVFLWALRDGDLVFARGLTFSVLVFSQVFRAAGARSPTRVFWQVGALSNLVLLAVIGASVAIQFALHRVALLRALFDLPPLSLRVAAVAAAVALVPVTAIELAKLVGSRNRRGAPLD